MAVTGVISEEEYRRRERKKAAKGDLKDTFAHVNIVRFVGEVSWRVRLRWKTEGMVTVTTPKTNILSASYSFSFIRSFIALDSSL